MPQCKSKINISTKRRKIAFKILIINPLLVQIQPKLAQTKSIVSNV